MRLARIFQFTLAAMAGLGAAALAGPDETGQWISPAQKVRVIELYTSEGCSSCPPADRWLSGFKDRRRLWQNLIPVAFHVDYWDYLGWHDRFASPDYSRRQRQYKAAGDLNAVYTPGFVIDGREWRGFFGTRKLPPAEVSRPGRLRLSRQADDITLKFNPEDAGHGPFMAHLVWLGFDLEHRIARGENAGKTLHHDFVVLGHQQRGPARDTWHFESRPPRRAGAIAAWITRADSLTPLQAVGGWLDETPR